MASPANPGEERGDQAERAAVEETYLDPVGGVAGHAFSAVPAEVQQMLNVKPGKTSARIQQVISWAAAADPDVLRQAQKHDRAIHTVAEVRAMPLRERDHIAKHFARQYRHKAALTGAITALPGGLWALVGMGADVQLTAIYAVRMAAKVAQSYGYDTTILEEQAHLADVLALAAGIDTLRGIGNWVAREGLAQILPDVLPRVLARLSVELSSEIAAKWIGRIIPGVSAAVGASVDYAFLRAAGERAIAYYHNRALTEAKGLPAATQPRALPPPSAPAISPAALEPTPAPVAPVALEPAPTPAPSAAPAPAAVVEPPHAEPAPVAAVDELAQTAPIRPARRRGRPWGLYFGIFIAVLAIATIIACAALGMLLSSGLHHLGL